jgi:hypothetical protein
MRELREDARRLAFGLGGILRADGHPFSDTVVVRSRGFVRRINATIRSRSPAVGAADSDFIECGR